MSHKNTDDSDAGTEKFTESKQVHDSSKSKSVYLRIESPRIEIWQQK